MKRGVNAGVCALLCAMVIAFAGCDTASNSGASGGAPASLAGNVYEGSISMSGQTMPIAAKFFAHDTCYVSILSSGFIDYSVEGSTLTVTDPDTGVELASGTISGSTISLTYAGMALELTYTESPSMYGTTLSGSYSGTVAGAASTITFAADGTASITSGGVSANCVYIIDDTYGSSSMLLCVIDDTEPMICTSSDNWDSFTLKDGDISALFEKA